MADDDNKWHLDKRVPLALIGTLIVQTLAIVWWAASLSQRVNDLERNAMAAVPRLESVIRLEAKVDNLHADVQEIKGSIKQLVNRR